MRLRGTGARRPVDGLGPFDADDLQRLAATLDRFLPHVDVSAIALAGGVAIQLHCHDAGVSSGRTRIADVDFVATSVDAVSASVTADLLIAHFHLPQPGYSKFLLQMVDPETRLRVDVFPDLGGAIAQASERTIAGRRLRMLAARSILDHKAQGISGASTSRPIDEKHARDAIVLAELCGCRISLPSPNALTRDVYRRDLTPCPRCDASRTATFAVAPRQRIFDILGYN